MSNKKNSGNISDMLWVLAKVKESVCAVDSGCVEAIYLLSEEITRTPDCDNIRIGIVNFREYVLPIIDLRQLLGIASREEEYQAFEDMLEHRKQDHIHWVQELTRCLEEDAPFHLATDPHKCAFGKWYDSYVPVSSTVSFHLKKIDEPHKKLHESAHEAFACKRDCDHCQRQECLRTVLTKGTHAYMEQVVALLDEAKAVFRDSYRQLVIVISEGSNVCGILVDEVLSVESLHQVDGNEYLPGIDDQSIVSCVAQKQNDSQLILVLNKNDILSISTDN